MATGLLVYAHGAFLFVSDAYGPCLLSLRALAFISRALARFVDFGDWLY